MDRFFYFLRVFLETVGMVIFIFSALFFLIGGAVVQFIFMARRAKRCDEAIEAMVSNPQSAQVDVAATLAGNRVSIGGKDPVDFANDLGKK